MYLGKLGSYKLGTEQGTKKFGFGIFGSALDNFGSVSVFTEKYWTDHKDM